VTRNPGSQILRRPWVSPSVAVPAAACTNPGAAVPTPTTHAVVPVLPSPTKTSPTIEPLASSTSPASVTAARSATPTTPATSAPSDTPVPSATPAPDPVLIAAGDIGSCVSSGDEATALLLEAISGTVVTLGDNVYERGTAEQFAGCYDPSW